MTYPVIESSRRVAFLVAGERQRSSARSALATVKCRRHAFDQLVRCIGLSTKRRPAENRCPVAQGRVSDEVWNFHTRSRACRSARWDAVGHHSGVSPVGRFCSIG
jgi:hypothetical protein